MKKFEKYMKKCLKLAQKGDGKTSPNPLVGCVVLDKNGKEISSGYHKKYGSLHAEADALSKLKDNQIKGSTLIVNLEPCVHFGKTPPCADLIIEKGVKTLVVAMKDPNPVVSGKGIEKCKKAGINVLEGILEEEARQLNEVFIKNMEKRAIFVATKIASTLDGKIAAQNGKSKWITGEYAREEVQKIRNRYDAILTTSATVIKDNPSLTCRIKNGKNPIRIVLDKDLKTDFKSKIYENNCEKIYVAVDKNTDKTRLSTVPAHVEIIKCPLKASKIDLNFLFKKLFEKEIRSILIEAGGNLNGELIFQDLADKIYLFMAPKIMNDKNAINSFYGEKTFKIDNLARFKISKIDKIAEDVLFILNK
ncbi:MAG TPA: bifunctional diaminohydroxyphosphoribosylaminopyrimidine deaminase/5-amino-6-(5-phosphoribosylamino)uracil reductase RibD [Candidatus Gastranaerophilaceae bacterium]|nr:bifunctional diaminohydroxyphosphoribosylaminopyrimidine deaminase/5-amino-6-(5-phosphoribosylamino)uracil reductase RibD [Candidatus Gastranaerophilaceae bacterium]